MTRVTQLIHDAGKYLLISVYPLPTHPTHNFTHNNGGNLETLPGWPKKLQHNRPARSAGQWSVYLPTHLSNVTYVFRGEKNNLQPRAQASHQPSEWCIRFAQMCRCVFTNRHKAVLFAWLNSMVPPEEPQNHWFILPHSMLLSPKGHH